VFGLPPRPQPHPQEELLQEAGGSAHLLGLIASVGGSASLVVWPVSSLPRPPLLESLQEEHASGRPSYPPPPSKHLLPRSPPVERAWEGQSAPSVLFPLAAYGQDYLGAQLGFWQRLPPAEQAPLGRVPLGRALARLPEVRYQALHLPGPRLPRGGLLLEVGVIPRLCALLLPLMLNPHRVHALAHQTWSPPGQHHPHQPLLEGRV